MRCEWFSGGRRGARGCWGLKVEEKGGMGLGFGVWLGVEVCLVVCFGHDVTEGLSRLEKVGMTEGDWGF